MTYATLHVQFKLRTVRIKVLRMSPVTDLSVNAGEKNLLFFKALGAALGLEYSCCCVKSIVNTAWFVLPLQTLVQDRSRKGSF